MHCFGKTLMYYIIDTILHKTQIVNFYNSPSFVQKRGRKFITQFFFRIQQISACWSPLINTLHNPIFLSHFGPSIRLFYQHLHTNILINRSYNHKDKEKQMIAFVFLCIWFLFHFWSRRAYLFIFALIKVFFFLSFLVPTCFSFHIFIYKSFY